MSGLGPVRIEAYLRRVEYEGSGRPSGVQGLRRLHLAHMRRVPFENLDIHLGREIVLWGESLCRKVVEDRRGGFCYELNGLFAALLSALGFQVRLLSARVIGADGVSGPEFDHLALLVDVRGRQQLADVGFGDSFQEPLSLQSRTSQTQASGTYRLEEAGGRKWSLLERTAGAVEEWRTCYSFTLEARRLDQFQEMCRHHQTSPDSPFTRNRMCTRATPVGRLSLSGMRTTETIHGRRQQRELEGEAEFWQVAEKRFGICVPRGKQALPSVLSDK